MIDDIFRVSLLGGGVGVIVVIVLIFLPEVVTDMPIGIFLLSVCIHMTKIAVVRLEELLVEIICLR